MGFWKTLRGEMQRQADAYTKGEAPYMPKPTPGLPGTGSPNTGPGSHGTGSPNTGGAPGTGSPNTGNQALPAAARAQLERDFHREYGRFPLSDHEFFTWLNHRA